MLKQKLVVISELEEGSSIKQISVNYVVNERTLYCIRSNKHKKVSSAGSSD
jgi:hypothetical protein